MLARALATPSNLLVLDEPTNDLDLETLDLLQEVIADYPGTVILVSHDRDFLDRTVTSVLAAEGDGRWIEYAGGYSDMLAQRGERACGARPGQPQRRARKACRNPPRRAGHGAKTEALLQGEARAGTLPESHRRAYLRGGGAAQNACRPGALRPRSGALSARAPPTSKPPSRLLRQPRSDWLELALLREDLGD